MRAFGNHIIFLHYIIAFFSGNEEQRQKGNQSSRALTPRTDSHRSDSRRRRRKHWSRNCQPLSQKKGRTVLCDENIFFFSFLIENILPYQQHGAVRTITESMVTVCSALATVHWCTWSAFEQLYIGRNMSNRFYVSQRLSCKCISSLIQTPFYVESPSASVVGEVDEELCQVPDSPIRGIGVIGWI